MDALEHLFSGMRISSAGLRAEQTVGVAAAAQALEAHGLLDI